MADVLRKFNFEGFPKPAMASSRNNRGRRKMNDQLNFFIPLSISHPLPPRPASPAKGQKKTSQPTDGEHIKTLSSPTKRQSEAGSDDAGDDDVGKEDGASQDHQRTALDAANRIFTSKQFDFRIQVDKDGSDPSEGDDDMSGSSASTILLSPSSTSALKLPTNAQPAPLVQSHALELEEKSARRFAPWPNSGLSISPPRSAKSSPSLKFPNPISTSHAFLSSGLRKSSPLSSSNGSTEHDPSSAKFSFKGFRILEEQSGEDADAEDNDDTDTASIRATRADSAELEPEIPDLISPDQDDEGLHTELAKKLLLGKRSRDDEITAAGEDAAAEHRGDSAGWAVHTDAQDFSHRRRGVSGRDAVKSGASTGSGSRSSGEEASDKAAKRTKREEGDEESNAISEQYCS